MPLQSMQKVITRILAATTLLLLASSASAYQVVMTSNYTPGTPLAVNDTVTVTVKYDTEGALNANNRLMLIGVGLYFDDSSLTYDQAASSATAIALGVGAPGADLIPASTCPNTNPTYPTYGVYQCGLFAIPPAQVQLDFLSSGLTSLIGISANSDPGGNVLGTLVFKVIDTSAATADFNLVFSTARGSVMTLQTGTNPNWTYVELTPTLVGDFTVDLPEPTSALLSFTALATVAALGGRRRGKR